MSSSRRRWTGTDQEIRAGMLEPAPLEVSHEEPPEVSHEEAPRPRPPVPGLPGGGRPEAGLLAAGPQRSARPAGRDADRRRIWPQHASAVLLATSCVICCAWYIPRVIRADGGLLTGTVVSNGTVNLNFGKDAVIGDIRVRAGQAVRAGQVLATEVAPDSAALVAADQASITADQAKISELKAMPVADETSELAAANAQLAKDQAQLVEDRAKLQATEILAPAAGVVVAVNGQPGETATQAGVKDYPSAAQPVQQDQQPPFSLLPEGPQAQSRGTGSAAMLPVIELRVSDSWQVVALVPQAVVSGVRAGQAVTIGVPAAHISGLPGVILEVLPTPTTGSGGVSYQAVVTVTGHGTRTPLSGMAADIDLRS